MENTENKVYSEEIQKMRHLMSFGLNENTKKNENHIVEYHQQAADGKTYGIIREGQKFYIKVAPKKETEVLAEDYDYIGGFMNKRDYEYNNYSLASKQFDLKLQSINEANRQNAVAMKQVQPTKAAEWQVNETKETRKEINRFSARFNQLLNNVDYILSENKEGKALEIGDPEVDMKSGNPFQEKPMETNKVNNMKENETDPKKADDTFKEKGEYKEDPNVGEHTDPKTADGTFSEKAPKPESDSVSVAAQKGASHKNENGVMNECKGKGRTFKLTEEQAKVLAWASDPNYMDTHKGTEIGSTAPYETTPSVKTKEMNAGTEKVEEAIHNSEDMNQHVAEPGDSDPFDKPVNEDMNDGQMLVDDQMNESEDSFEIDLDSSAEPMNETKLDVFGKHPAYQKVPMTTPPNKEIDKFGRDWNDDSAKGEQPFGTKIGHSGDPYEDVIEILTDNIMKAMGKKKIN